MVDQSSSRLVCGSASYDTRAGSATGPDAVSRPMRAIAAAASPSRLLRERARSERQATVARTQPRVVLSHRSTPPPNVEVWFLALLIGFGRGGFP